jgi:glutamate racemase
VLAEIRAQLPHENVIYVADQRWAPYGERSLEDVRARAIQIAGQMIEAGAKAVVVACNSASAAALHHLREVYHGVPFVGMEPAVKPAALESGTGVVGVIATTATFQGELFASVVDRHANGVTVLTQAAPGLVEMVEEGLEQPVAARSVLQSALAPMVAQGMDTLVLGCTHYSFLARLIREVVGDEVVIVDPAGAVARQVGRVLEERDLVAPQDGSAKVDYRTTLDPDRFAAAFERLTGSPPESRPMRW